MATVQSFAMVYRNIFLGYYKSSVSFYCYNDHCRGPLEHLETEGLPVQGEREVKMESQAAPEDWVAVDLRYIRASINFEGFVIVLVSPENILYQCFCLYLGRGWRPWLEGRNWCTWKTCKSAT